MSLRTIRLELARSHEFPAGSSRHGYEFRAPLDADGKIDAEAWKRHRNDCTVRRFWDGAEDESGLLVHTRGRKWVFSYVPDETSDDEPIFKFDGHIFRPGEYVSITEHDGVQRPFRVASVR
ncbi:MAG: hypothetical protein FJX35_10805 [Alphaproteobacteria bacterium]|nr:hypothetical protein [Alphaproteobacteria bacterium]